MSVEKKRKATVPNTRCIQRLLVLRFGIARLSRKGVTNQQITRNKRKIYLPSFPLSYGLNVRVD